VGRVRASGATNLNQFLATVPPDSYYVVWGQYGIVGFIVRLVLCSYPVSAGIKFKYIQDPHLRQKLLALTAIAVSLVCSYGNEIMNQMFSAMILYVSGYLPGSYAVIPPSQFLHPMSAADFIHFINYNQAQGDVCYVGFCYASLRTNYEVMRLIMLHPVKTLAVLKQSFQK